MSTIVIKVIPFSYEAAFDYLYNFVKSKGAQVIKVHPEQGILKFSLPLSWRDTAWGYNCTARFISSNASSTTIQFVSYVIGFDWFNYSKKKIDNFLLNFSTLACPKCGASISDNTTFCSNCGKRIH